MKINPIPFALASALTASILWIVCSLVVFAMPEMMMNMSGNMVHTNLNGMHWDLTWSGVFIGLVGWGVLAGIFGWFLAFVYNVVNK